MATQTIPEFFFGKHPMFFWKQALIFRKQTLFSRMQKNRLGNNSPCEYYPIRMLGIY